MTDQIDTLLDLLKKYEVEIPIIQRDYAQGRKDAETKNIRVRLLNDMKSAIEKKSHPLDLNFVYGKKDGNKFIPVDGQQRLTTLFLLHLYAFAQDESKTELLKKFSYETRESSRDFFEKLIDKRKDIFTASDIPSKEIQDLPWFSYGWKNDPTIQSVLTMLDEIKTVFGDLKNLGDSLSDSKPIVFKFMPIKDLGNEDDLYIKLNARGRPLTRLENFKAQFIGRFKELNLQELENFELLMDTKWTDLFWSKDSKEFDKTYLEFFRQIISNTIVYSPDKKPEGFENWEEDKMWERNPDYYSSIKANVFETVYHTLNYLCDGKDELCKTAQDLIFKALDSNVRDRIIFHAITIYLHSSKGIDTGSFKQWIRIIKNLALNSINIDDYELYGNAIKAINKLIEHRDDLLNYFSNENKISTFNNEQTKEEQEKAKIILSDDDFADQIYKAEEHPYFDGQIRSALYYAKEGESYNKEVFKKYWKKISALFDEDEKRSKYGHLLRQALLVFGDYTLPVSKCKTLCIDDPYESSSTPSLKRLFSNNGTIVEELLDRINDVGNIKTELETIIRKEKENIPKNDWRYCFICFPKLFDCMNPNYLRLREVGEMIIVPSERISGKNTYVFIAALFLTIKERGYLEFSDELGTDADRYLLVKKSGHKIRFKNKQFTVKDSNDAFVCETKSDDPIAEMENYLISDEFKEFLTSPEPKTP